MGSLRGMSGRRVPTAPALAHFPEGTLFVCIVDRAWVRAARSSSSGKRHRYLAPTTARPALELDGRLEARLVRDLAPQAHEPDLPRPGIFAHLRGPRRRRLPSLAPRGEAERLRLPKPRGGGWRWGSARRGPLRERDHQPDPRDLVAGGCAPWSGFPLRTHYARPGRQALALVGSTGLSNFQYGTAISGPGWGRDREAVCAD